MSHDLRFAREIDGAPEKVFDAFTQPGGQEAFYGTDDPGWIVESECEFRVGGVWTGGPRALARRGVADDRRSAEPPFPPVRDSASGLECRPV